MAPIRKRWGLPQIGASGSDGFADRTAGGGIGPVARRLAGGGRGAGGGRPDPATGSDDDPGQILWNPDQVTLGESLFPPVAGRWSITTEVSCGFHVDFDPDTLGPLLPDDRGATDLLAGWRYVQLSANGVTFSATVQPGQIVPVTGARNTYYADLTTSDDVALVTTPSGGGGPGIEVALVSAYVIIRGARLGPTP